MELESKILSKEILQYLYAGGKTLGTAESCTGGRIAQVIIAVPGASNYFKGGIVSYSNDVKERLLHVDSKLIEEQTAVCQGVAETPPATATWVMPVCRTALRSLFISISTIVASRLAAISSL